MSWIEYIAIYAFIWGISASVFSLLYNEEKGTVFFAFCWPITVPFIIAFTLTEYIQDYIKRVKHGS